MDKKPGTSSLDGCLHDPPRLPPKVKVLTRTEPLPERDFEGTLHFPDYPNFLPNLTPAEVLQLGSFGGTYFRDISSAVTGHTFKGADVIREFPKTWFRGLEIDVHVCSPTYDKSVNKYRVSCGGSLGQWETSGWISSLDPYGWFQWYCRFYLGRRTSDDTRQIKRWLAGQGPKGRFRSRVCGDIVRSGVSWDDEKVSRVCRQVLQHWAYRLTEADLERYLSR